MPNGLPPALVPPPKRLTGDTGLLALPDHVRVPNKGAVGGRRADCEPEADELRSASAAAAASVAWSCGPASNTSLSGITMSYEAACKLPLRLRVAGRPPRGGLPTPAAAAPSLPPAVADSSDMERLRTEVRTSRLGPLPSVKLERAALRGGSASSSSTAPGAPVALAGRAASVADTARAGRPGVPALAARPVALLAASAGSVDVGSALHDRARAAGGGVGEASRPTPLRRTRSSHAAAGLSASALYAAPPLTADSGDGDKLDDVAEEPSATVSPAGPDRPPPPVPPVPAVPPPPLPPMGKPSAPPSAAAAVASDDGKLALTVRRP